MMACFLFLTLGTLGRFCLRVDVVAFGAVINGDVALEITRYVYAIN